MATDQPTSHQSKNGVIILLVLILVALVVGGGYFIMQDQADRRQIAEAQDKEEAEKARQADFNRRARDVINKARALGY